MTGSTRVRDIPPPILSLGAFLTPPPTSSLPSTKPSQTFQMLLVGHTLLTTVDNSLGLSPSLWSIRGPAFPLPQKHRHVVTQRRVLVCSQRGLHNGPQMRTSQITISYGIDTLTTHGMEYHTAMNERMNDLQLYPNRDQSYEPNVDRKTQTQWRTRLRGPFIYRPKTGTATPLCLRGTQCAPGSSQRLLSKVEAAGHRESGLASRRVLTSRI